MKVHLEIAVLGENSPHFYKNKNIIYSLLSPPILYSEKGNDNQSRTNGPINANLTIAQVMPRYNHNNEKQEALL